MVQHGAEVGRCPAGLWIVWLHPKVSAEQPCFEWVGAARTLALLHRRLPYCTSAPSSQQRQRIGMVQAQGGCIFAGVAGAEQASRLMVGASTLVSSESRLVRRDGTLFVVMGLHSRH